MHRIDSHRTRGTCGTRGLARVAAAMPTAVAMLFCTLACTVALACASPSVAFADDAATGGAASGETVGMTSDGSASGDTTLTTTVPASHTVVLSIADHATVTIDGVAYAGPCETSVAIGRLVEQRYAIVADKGYEIASVTYAGEPVSLVDGAFVAPALNEDGLTLTVTVSKATVIPTVTPDGKPGGDPGRRPADTGASVAPPALAAGTALTTAVRRRRTA